MTKPDARDFPGLGKLRCFICGDPYVEHPMRPCEKLGMNVVYAPRYKRAKGSAIDRKESTWQEEQ